MHFHLLDHNAASCVFCALCHILLGTRLHAQTGSITGTVVDPSGAAIPGAQVQITDQATGNLTREATSDGGGVFRALNVPPGTYKVKVTAAGMQELDRNGVILDQDQSLGLGQVALTLGAHRRPLP